MSILQKLERKGVTLEPKLTFKSSAPLDAETLTLLKTNKADLLIDLTAPGMVPRLPWQLERLVRAASSDQLPGGSTLLKAGLVTDLNRYTLAWGCSYLTGDRDEALSRLWAVYRAWQGVN